MGSYHGGHGALEAPKITAGCDCLKSSECSALSQLNRVLRAVNQSIENYANKLIKLMATIHSGRSRNQTLSIIIMIVELNWEISHDANVWFHPAILKQKEALCSVCVWSVYRTDPKLGAWTLL